MREINVGLVGFGMAGRVFHAPIISSVEGLRLKKVVERNSANSKEIYPYVEVVKSIDELLTDNDIDLIVIATPNGNHYEAAMKAINAGKNVVVEKPFTVIYEEALKLIKAAEEKDVILSVNQNRRFDSDFLTIQKLIKEKRFGKIVNYEARYDRFRKGIKQNTWKEVESPGSGILYDLGSHLIDQVLVLFGNPEYITAFISSEREFSTIDDNFELIMEYTNMRVSLNAGMMVRDNSLRYSINGTEGSYTKNGVDIQEEKLKAGKFPSDDTKWGIEPSNQYGKFIYELNGVTTSETIVSEEGNYKLYYEDIREAILEKRKPYVSGIDGANVIKVIECAMKSRKEKRAVKFESAFQV